MSGAWDPRPPSFRPLSLDVAAGLWFGVFSRSFSAGARSVPRACARPNEPQRLPSPWMMTIFFCGVSPISSVVVHIFFFFFFSAPPPLSAPSTSALGQRLTASVAVFSPRATRRLGVRSIPLPRIWPLLPPCAQQPTAVVVPLFFAYAGSARILHRRLAHKRFKRLFLSRTLHSLAFLRPPWSQPTPRLVFRALSTRRSFFPGATVALKARGSSIESAGTRAEGVDATRCAGVESSGQVWRQEGTCISAEHLCGSLRRIASRVDANVHDGRGGTVRCAESVLGPRSTGPAPSVDRTSPPASSPAPSVDRAAPPAWCPAPPLTPSPSLRLPRAPHPPPSLPPSLRLPSPRGLPARAMRRPARRSARVPEPRHRLGG